MDIQVYKASPKKKFGFQVLNKIPPEILLDPILNDEIDALLPKNYNFEVHKTIWKIETTKARNIALQLPEGLAIFACTISDIIENYFKRKGDLNFLKNVFIFGDVTYGACCIDDFTCKSLNIELLIHYGHSCLIPTQITNAQDETNPLTFSVLYVFVEILFDCTHFVESVKHNFPQNSHIYVGATVQFIGSLPKIITSLSSYLSEKGKVSYIDRQMPLSRGEVLGCTAPRIHLQENQAEMVQNVIIFIADGRFHLEALMIANHDFPGNFYLYNPYDKKLTRETYDTSATFADRTKAIQSSIDIMFKTILVPEHPCNIGIILSTLGRQGSPNILNVLTDNIHKVNSLIERKVESNTSLTVPRLNYITVLMSEISPEKLALFSGSDAENTHTSPNIWIQIGCPRLSIDWAASNYTCPLLNPYEAIQTFNHMQQCLLQENVNHITTNKQETFPLLKDYPMDYYAYESGGPWTPAHKPDYPKAKCKCKS